MRDASVFSTKTWPVEPHACGLPCVSAGTWGRHAASTRVAGWRGSRPGSRRDRGRRPRKCRLRARSACNGRDDGRRSPDPAGDISGHGSDVERGSALERRVDHRDDPEGSGVLPRAFAFCQQRARATRWRRRRQQSGGRRQAGVAHDGVAREASPTGGSSQVSNAGTQDTVLNDEEPYLGDTSGSEQAGRMTFHRRGGSRSCRHGDHRGSGAVDLEGAPAPVRAEAPLKRWGPVPGDPGESGPRGDRR